MQYHFDLLRATRSNILKVVNNLSMEQLNSIPERFNNNMVWNLGHVLATQQSLHYRLSNAQMIIPTDFYERYKKGTKPLQSIGMAEIDFLKEKLLYSVDQLLVDFNSDKLSNYTTYTTSYGATVSTIEEAIVFNNAHEALHLGYMMAMRKKI